MLSPDLHTHTNASDGTLSPSELIQRAVARGVSHLAITDHDTINAYHQLSRQPTPELTLVPGIELSARWMKTGVHIVGLNIDLEDLKLQQCIERQQQARQARAKTIALRLQKCGLPDLLPAAMAMAGSSSIGRPHFARCLVEQGFSKDFKAAFKRYLGNGKAGDVRQLWPTISEVIPWIADAGGTAVLAHPARYKMTATKVRELVADFSAAGGEAMEVVCGQQRPEITNRLADLAVDYGLSASCGSDFHSPDNRWSDLGQFPALPSGVTPVWERWKTNAHCG